MPVLILLAGVFLTGCGHPKQARVNVPSPPPIAQPTPQPSERPTVSETPGPRPPAAKPPEQAEADESEEVFSIPADTQPMFTETGIASWYGPPYHNRRGSNGEIYNMHALTAAHRTLPLGSICRVTNVKTGNSTLVRITDRGPFIEGRILDLSLAAAKKVDVWRQGLATVKVELLQTPAPLNTGGRWAVQIGAFDDEETAGKLADHLTRKYHTAKVLRFASPTGDWWVRVRVQDDDKKRAEEVARTTETEQGAVFLVRLD